MVGETSLAILESKGDTERAFELLDGDKGDRNREDHRDGESREDRVGMVVALASLPVHPESVPINLLVQVAGTPLEGTAELDRFEFVRMIAVARITMPGSMVRLSAGREAMSDEMQALCFLAGANSIFCGEKLLTTPNPARDHDRDLMERLGLRPMGA